LTPNRISQEPSLKAGALLCPVCCVELVETEADFDVDGTILRNIKILSCPICQEEQLSEHQRKAVEEILETLKRKSGINP
jgi:uncharacterized Zn finger protein (UPF0148 family)